MTNLITLVRGNDRYAWIYDDESTSELLRDIGRTASNPMLNFTWYDAAKLSQLIQERKKSKGVCKWR